MTELNVAKHHGAGQSVECVPCLDLPGKASRRWGLASGVWATVRLNILKRAMLDGRTGCVLESMSRQPVGCSWS